MTLDLCGKYLVGSLLENLEKYGKIGCFSGGYGRMGEIQHGRICLDWGLMDIFID